jgi:hypothetical protein
MIATILHLILVSLYVWLYLTHVSCGTLYVLWSLDQLRLVLNMICFRMCAEGSLLTFGIHYEIILEMGCGPLL